MISESNINFEYNKNYNNILWCYIDIYTGKINIYPDYISNEIENSYKSKKKILRIPKYNNFILHFTEKGIFETKPYANISVFREIINNDQNSITKYVFLEDNYYYLYSQTTHIGLFVDKSTSMCSVYNKVITYADKYFLNEQKKSPDNLLFYGMAFSDKNDYNILFDSVDLKLQNNISENFLKIKPFGCTAFNDSFNIFIELIESKIKLGDQVIICIISDGEDNSSKTSNEKIRNLILEKKNQKWNFVVLGVNKYNVSKFSINYKFSNSQLLNIGPSDNETINAFNSVNSSIKKIRNGSNTCIEFTDLDRLLADIEYTCK